MAQSILASIDSITEDYGEAMFFNSTFLNYIEPHIKWILSRTDTISLYPSKMDQTVYRGDLHGYILSVSVTYAPYLAIATRLTGLTNSNQFTKGVDNVYIPSPACMNQLLNQFQISNVITM
jgi:hypothetical protein